MSLLRTARAHRGHHVHRRTRAHGRAAARQQGSGPPSMRRRRRPPFRCLSPHPRRPHCPPVAAPAPPDTATMIEQLKQLGELKAAGVLTEIEFEVQKARILQGI